MDAFPTLSRRAAEVIPSLLPDMFSAVIRNKAGNNPGLLPRSTSFREGALGPSSILRLPSRKGPRGAWIMTKN